LFNGFQNVVIKEISDYQKVIDLLIS